MDPRVVRTRNLLRAALITLITERGFEPITVQDITDRATLNRATFYLHYSDKTELLMDALEELISLAAPLPESAYTQQPGLAIIHVFTHVAQHADFFKVMLTQESIPRFVERIQHFIEDVGLKWLTALQPDHDKMIVPPEIAISYLGSAFLGVIAWWLRQGMPYTPEYMANKLMVLSARGTRRSLGLEPAGLDLPDDT